MTTLQGADAQSAKFPGRYQFHDVWDAGPAGLNFSRQQPVHHRRPAAIRHVEKLDADPLSEDRKREMMDRTRARRTKAHLARLRLRERDELSKRSRLNIGMDDQDRRQSHQPSDWCEVL